MMASAKVWFCIFKNQSLFNICIPRVNSNFLTFVDMSYRSMRSPNLLGEQLADHREP